MYTQSAFAFLFFLGVAQASVLGEDLSEVRSALKAQHHKLMATPGGMDITYNVAVEQSETKPYFLFAKGLKGRTVLRWPELYCLEDGVFFGFASKQSGERIPQQAVREGLYNFESKYSVARMDDSLAQVTPYRHAFTTHSYLLKYQFFEEVDQEYLSTDDYASEYWLPSAFRNSGYSIVPDETVGGVTCLCIEKPGLDKVWLSRTHDWLVMKREFHFGLGKCLRERMVVESVQKYGEAWLPKRLVREEFSEDSSRLFKLTLDVKNVKIGGIGDKDLTPAIPKTSLIQDQVNSVWIQPGAEDRRFDDAVLQSNSQSSRSRFMKTAIMRLNGVLALVTVLLIAVTVGLKARS